MKNLITIIGLVVAIATILFLTSCGSKYYLQRAHINTYKAIALGAKVDSATTIKHDTVKVWGVVDDKAPADKVIDEPAVDTACAHLLRQLLTSHNQQKQGVAQLQKLVCPDVGLDSIYTVWVSVSAHKYPLKIHVQACSKGGKVSYHMDVHNAEIPYKIAISNPAITPANDGLKWWQVTLICTLVGVVALVVGFVFGWTKSKS